MADKGNWFPGIPPYESQPQPVHECIGPECTKAVPTENTACCRECLREHEESLYEDDDPWADIPPDDSDLVDSRGRRRFGRPVESYFLHDNGSITSTSRPYPRRRRR